MKFINFISFCIFFNKKMGEWPNVLQGKMFFLAESEAKNLVECYPRRSGVTTFLCVYVIWKALKNKNLNFVYLSSHYGSRGLIDLIWGEDVSNLKTMADFPMSQPAIDYLIVDNEKITQKDLTFFLTSFQKSISFYT